MIVTERKYWNVYDGKGVYMGRFSDSWMEESGIETDAVEKNPEGFDVVLLTGGPLDHEYRIIMLDGETWFPENG